MKVCGLKKNYAPTHYKFSIIFMLKLCYWHLANALNIRSDTNRVYVILELNPWIQCPYQRAQAQMKMGKLSQDMMTKNEIISNDYAKPLKHHHSNTGRRMKLLRFADQCNGTSKFIFFVRKARLFEVIGLAAYERRQVSNILHILLEIEREIEMRSSVYFYIQNLKIAQRIRTWNVRFWCSTFVAM